MARTDLHSIGCKRKEYIMRIPVVFATDENYLFYMCISITSMAQNAKKDTFYQIYVLVDSSFEDSAHLLSKVMQKYSNIHIETICVSESMFRNTKIHNKHVTKATFYRLALCELIKEDKCIYLDGDTIVTEDLEKLYNVELGPNYLAGCRDIWIDFLSADEQEERRMKTGISSLNQYINAGVLIFNLQQIKADRMNVKFIEEMEHDYPHEDQDILNVCCYGKILRLPAKWNLFTVFMGNINQMKQAGIDEPVLIDYMKKSGIIHYATSASRPWEREDGWMNKVWWEVAKEWEAEEAFQKVKRKVEERTKKNEWKYYVDLCSKYRQIVIFGYTHYSEELYDWIKKLEMAHRIVFCDNNPEKQGMKYKGVPVLSFTEALRRNREELESTLFLIASQRKAGEIREFLIGNGIKSGQIESYQRKDESYYLYLDESFFMEEIQDICEREKVDGKVFQAMELPEIKEMLLKDAAFQEWHKKYYLKSWLLKE